MNKKNLNVAIIGGGIGGVATALALQEQGIQAHVYEQASALTEVGAGIIIHPPTQHLLKKWGLGDIFEQKGFTNKTFELYTSQGQFITSVTNKHISSLSDDPNELAPRSIHRAHLLNLLLSPLSEEFIHLQHTCETLNEQDDHVEIRFTNGEVVNADVVIAANGIHSNIRNLFSDDKPIYSGLHSIRTILSREATQHVAKENATVVYQDGKIVILMQPVENGMHFDIIFPSEDASWVLHLEKEDILPRISDFDEKIVALLDEIEYPIISRGLYSRKPIDRWSTKRITLLGDAAHAMLPTLGQGANSAIQDAEVIAIAFSECDTVAEALQRYEAERRPITAKIQTESKGFDLAFKN